MELIAYALALVAAFIYVAGTAVQQLGVIKAQQREGPLLLVLLTTPLWIGGLALLVAGFGVHAAALGLGSLAVISVLQTSEVLYMLPLSKWTSGIAITRREYIGAAVVGVGLIGTVLLGKVTEGTTDPDSTDLLVASGLCICAAALIGLLSRVAGPLRAGVLGAAAGVLYAVMAALTKVVADSVFSEGVFSIFLDWQLYGLVVVGLMAMGTQALALGAGLLSAVLPAILVFNPITSTILAVTVFQEQFTTSGFGWVLLGLSAALAIGGAAVLAQSPAIADAH